MSYNVFIFAARLKAPTEADLRAAVTPQEGIYIKMDQSPKDVAFEAGELAYVEAVLGAFRLDTITYRGGTLATVADLLERVYSKVPALADPDGDGLFPIPDLVRLMRSYGGAGFTPWADPAKRA